MSGETDYYATLGVDPHASQETIREAFAELLAQVTETSPRFSQLKHAYEVLVNPERRATYDTLLRETAVSDLTIQAEPSRDKLNLSTQEQLFYLLVDIIPPTKKAYAKRPLNLCLVIDHSTSMQGVRLNHVKSAVDLIVEKLSPQDRLTVISFSDRANVIIAPTSEPNPREVTNKVRSIQASGGTEIFQGLTTGFQTMQQLDLANYTNHLILLTDGHTYGDEQECLQLAHHAAKKNVGMSAFGIGHEWNDTFLDHLVSASGGQSEYIESPQQIINFLQKRIQGLGAVYAENLRLQLKMPTGLALKEAFKLAPFAQPLQANEDEIHLGHVESRSSLTFIMEITLKPQPIETRITIPLAFTADFANSPQPRTFKEQVRLTVLRDAPKVEPSAKLVDAVRNLNFYRMNEKIWRDVADGHLQQATQRMRHLTTRLLEIGETGLAEQANMELERLKSAGDLSNEGRKRLKYGTRALISPISEMDEE